MTGKTREAFTDEEWDMIETIRENREDDGFRLPIERKHGCKAMLDGRVISKDLGMNLENVGLNMLGRAKHVHIEKENTAIVDGAGKKADIKSRIAKIKQQFEETTSDYDREKLQERLAKLAGGVAVIRVGGTTEVDVKEKKDRVDDAMHASQRRYCRHPGREKSGRPVKLG